MSQTYIAAFVAFLSGVLPFVGFEVADSNVLTNNILNIVTVAAALWAIYRRVRVGDIGWTGIKKR